MKSKTIIPLVIAFTIIIGTSVYAANVNDFKRPFSNTVNGPHFMASIYAELAGIELEEVMELCYETGKSVPTLAYEDGLYDEFVEELLKVRRENLQYAVELDRLTQEEADEILEQYKDQIMEYNSENLYFGRPAYGMPGGCGRQGNGTYGPNNRGARFGNPYNQNQRMNK